MQGCHCRPAAHRDSRADARKLPFSGRKKGYLEGGIRTPCFVTWQGHLPLGVVSNRVGIMKDWTATMLALADAHPPATCPLDGINLLLVLARFEPEFTRTLYWHNRGPSGIITERAMRSGNRKYLWWPDGRQELYDLTTDVAERNDLAAVRPSLVREMRLHIDAWERGISPPLYDQDTRLDQLQTLANCSVMHYRQHC